MNMQLKDSYKFGTLYTFKEAGVGGGGQKISLNFTKPAEIFCFRRTSWR